ncbi:uncharacterized protein BX663DRAFT_137209 [Cokeromyces recurvatus]|uniref:uncharacterized protein n=1 Tax=Cokeromyces recurvatus TaxID=90255 RepID=UPI00221F015C|nr:uncharacterized protein BX663DRAFT_137209 [Cokeromyces recurvatus]KAI7907408.1 hypothetical protein BX663DRAFT_137209 [Cokeromyces recurvatus]
MALHFLMAGLENPLIPSLQNLNVRCENKSCNSRAFNKIIPVFYNNHIIHCDVRYHDCVCIRQRSYPLKKQNNDVTLWEGNNKDTVAELVTKFFLFYSDAVNYVVSIITDDGKPVGNIDMNFWPERPIIVQDPFILTKNVARTCTSVGFSIILEEFRRAAKLLMKHVSFATVCDKQLNLPRFIDTQCLDYRIQIRKQKKMIAKEMRKQHKEIRLQQKQPPQQETKLTTPTTTKDHVIGYLDDDDDNSKEEQLIKWLAPYLSDNNEIEENNNNNTKTIRSKESAEIVKSVLDEFTEALFTGEYYEEEEEVSDEVEEIKNMDHKEISILPTYFPLQFPNLDDDDKEEEEDSDLDSNDTENSNRDTELRPLFFNNEDQQISSSGTAETPTSSSTSKMITNDTTDNMDSKPILNLVKKLISYQPPSTSADDINGHSLKQLTTVPCTDMQKLLDDPCMSDIDMKDICYLVAQLNFLSDAVTHRLLNRKEKEAEAKQKTGSEIGRSNLALKNLDNTLYQMQNTTSKRPSSEKLVDVFFTVENVPAAFDAYIIYTEFYWYGQVLDVSPAETRTENSTTGSLTTKWNVHMKLTYENYKIGSIPRTIQYNADCIDDCFYVSEPVLLSPSV